MTFLDLMQKAGWSRLETARRFRVNERTIRRWIAGTSRVPPPIMEYMGVVCAILDKHPPPADWQKNVAEDE